MWDTFKNILHNDSTQASKFFTKSDWQLSLSFFIFCDNIAHIKHKDFCFSKDNLEIHITWKTCVEMNALKCVENNPFFMFNSQRAIPWLVHSFTPLNFLTESSKKLTVSTSPFFRFSHIFKDQGIYSFRFFVEPLIASSTSCHEWAFIYVWIGVWKRHLTVVIYLNAMLNWFTTLVFFDGIWEWF